MTKIGPKHHISGASTEGARKPSAKLVKLAGKIESAAQSLDDGAAAAARFLSRKSQGLGARQPTEEGKSRKEIKKMSEGVNHAAHSVFGNKAVIRQMKSF